MQPDVTALTSQERVEGVGSFEPISVPVIRHTSFTHYTPPPAATMEFADVCYGRSEIPRLQELYGKEGYRAVTLDECIQRVSWCSV
ncbi:hypothetical protein DPEC_G00176120 [Dallia pectoralis]|uniref:Uncharacterized protein n=1 Tax=Dallia pectoralis TaxID=75939 RepID=A0ACC2GEA3_DALPE|nr:hypothetical protein DPEC_G00176120 [Dallia pectoralis]